MCGVDHNNWLLLALFSGKDCSSLPEIFTVRRRIINFLRGDKTLPAYGQQSGEKIVYNCAVHMFFNNETASPNWRSCFKEFNALRQTKEIRDYFFFFWLYLYLLKKLFVEGDTGSWNGVICNSLLESSAYRQYYFNPFWMSLMCVGRMQVQRLIINISATGTVLRGELYFGNTWNIPWMYF